MINKDKKNGFTLVELLAVIVILAIILVIAVPKVMSVIEDSKKATLESTAKMIASAAEKAKVQNTVLGKDEEITCDSVAKINKLDYDTCEVEFVDNTAKVTIAGKGKFEGLWVCNGDKTNANAQKDSCSPELSSIDVKHPLFLSGQELTPDKFVVTATYKDGTTRILEDGTNEGVVDEKAVTLTSPNWPNNYPKNMTEEENTWEYTFEGAVGIQVTFDETSSLANESYYECEFADASLQIEFSYKNQKWPLAVCSTFFAGKTYTFNSDYIKITMVSDDRETDKGFSAVIKPIYKLEPEYTISPSVVPNITGNFDMTISVKDSNTSKKITTSAGPYEIEEYVVNHKGFDTRQTTETYTNSNNEEITLNSGTRYFGKTENVNNKVFFNCEPTDGTNAYGSEDYNYESSCEVWSMIGAFEVEDGNGNKDLRVKLINTNSTFEATFNSVDASNQWAPSTHAATGEEFLGSEIMRLLNGYYIGESTTCAYNDERYQDTLAKTCTTESLKEAKMKPLTSTALNMIDNALWHTYAVGFDEGSTYLQERGITTKGTGCFDHQSDYDHSGMGCPIPVNEWTGLVGLMYASDAEYAGDWLGHYSIDAFHINPEAQAENDRSISGGGYVDYPSDVWPTVYLKPNIKIIGGNGNTEPFKLAM